ncbi:SDR family NAD(P)-dependent oxidoreductase [Pigmentiphaga sp. H8]|uniref:SDR family NAD(P)-dependent oxidoreductase n=1 Tax=unclassified Pigmentiphaga TaxID=2626614 RepID=UPI000F5B715A|nr:SDR family NAD(P)-dependent oxidoreductase [Pigmentiphaga sp. H8]AZG08873.1 SDR family NAD(P)-dependent oxidoreductase [Pigmentiphaga sp. H8]
MKIEGLAALVTGGASGLGAQTARLLAARGAKVAVLDRNAAQAQAVATDIGGLALTCDVTDADSVQQALDAARGQHGPARVLVNCAGVGGAHRITGKQGPMPLADFSRIVQINLVGTFNVMRLAAAGMTALDPLDDGERGVMVNTTSIAAYDGQMGQTAYAASKGGIAALTLPAARDLAQFGVRVMAIAPGLFRTPLLDELPPEVQTSLGGSVPFPKRLGQPAEFAALVAHIVENAYLNGEVIRLDGALRMPPR